MFQNITILNFGEGELDSEKVCVCVCVSVAKSYHISHHYFFLIFCTKSSFNKRRIVTFSDFAKKILFLHN